MKFRRNFYSIIESHSGEKSNARNITKQLTTGWRDVWEFCNSEKLWIFFVVSDKKKHVNEMKSQMLSIFWNDFHATAAHDFN